MLRWLSQKRDNAILSMKLKSKFHFALVVSILAVFFFAFLSIPLCSFNKQLYLVTWGLTIVFLLLMAIEIFFFTELRFDLILLSLLLFPISAVISSALTGFRAFLFTPILLTLCTAVIYVFCKTNRNKALSLLYVAVVADVIFMIIFVVYYRNDIIHLNFQRLGAAFGDENDISLFMAFGLVSMIFFSIFNKKILVKILSIIFGIAFLVCGLSSGSKIFIIILIFFAILTPFMVFGKKRWWIALIIVLSLITIGVVVLSLPAFSFVRKRLLDFFSTLAGRRIEQTSSTYDLSTIERIEMFVNGMQMFLRKPLFGWGIWGFATYGGYSYSWSHNNISESLCNFGLVGTFLFHFGFFSSFRNYYKSSPEERKKNY